MKSRILMLMLVGVALATSAFASGIKADVNRKVLSSFSSKFANAKEISWSKTSSYVKASFRLDNQFLFAYYMDNGELIGVSRNIKSTELPLNLQSNLKEDYSNTWISELFEFSTEEQTIYVATVENADAKFILKSSDGNNWNTTQTIKKP